MDRVQGDQDNKLKIFKIITRAMDDVRGLDSKYPRKEDARLLARTLNEIAEDALEKIMRVIEQ
tara:strand:- start:699 stop:887 length:189 start_codon:yes stop_codon:yes gene_type:complete